MLVKYWAKKRALNDGFLICVLCWILIDLIAARGATLSSYTWTLIVINFLQQRNPPILPSLQEIYHESKSKSRECHQLSSSSNLLATHQSCQTTIIENIDTSFFDDMTSLSHFGARNNETIQELFYSFFMHFAFEFDYNRSVISVRAGRNLSKIEKGWHEGEHTNSFS